MSEVNCRYHATTGVRTKPRQRLYLLTCIAIEALVLFGLYSVLHHPIRHRVRRHEQDLAPVWKHNHSDEGRGPTEDEFFCETRHHIDYPYVRAIASTFRKETATALECCNACWELALSTDEVVRCNVWAYCKDAKKCGKDYQTCWLHAEPHLQDILEVNGTEVPYSAGNIQFESARWPTPLQPSDLRKRRFHTIVTAQGPAQQWQARILYYSFKKQKAICEKGPWCLMGGFTRILHSGTADDLMDEIPTFISDPMPASFSSKDPSRYVVLSRPYAVMEWLLGAKIEEDYVFMAEPDYVLIKPLPNLMLRDRPAFYEFSYIRPYDAKMGPLVVKFTGPLTQKELRDIPRTGSAPSMMSLRDLSLVAPKWLELALAIYGDSDASQAWGWVQEMYAFSIAVYLTLRKEKDYVEIFMAQPPFDKSIVSSKNHPLYLLHYTYPMELVQRNSSSEDDLKKWIFDKRMFMDSAPRIADVVNHTTGLNSESEVALMSAIEEAMKSMQCWDQYAQTLKLSDSYC